MAIDLDKQAKLLNEEANQQVQLDELYQLQTALELMRKNLLLNNFDPNAKIVTVTNTNLYKLAETYYGNSVLWTAIAKANKLTDPQIPGTLTLIIPNSPENTGGILEY